MGLTINHRIKVALRDENTRSWNEVERDFLDSEYRAVRDRQMKELELEDDLLSKVPVRYAVCKFARRIWIADRRRVGT